MTKARGCCVLRHGTLLIWPSSGLELEDKVFITRVSRHGFLW